MGLPIAYSRQAPFALRLAGAFFDICRFAGPVLVAVWLVLLVLLGKPNSRPEVYSNTVFLHGMFATAALAYVAWLLLARRLPGPTRLDWCALGLMAAFCISVATSVNARVSLEASLLFAMAVVTFYMVHDFEGLSGEFWTRMLVLVAAIAGIAGLVSIVSQYSAWLQQVAAVKGSLETADYLPPSIFRVRQILNHPSPFAMLLNLALPFAAARAIACRGMERKLSALALLIGLLAVFFSLTRGAWIATAAWAFVFAVLLLARRHHFEHLWQLTQLLRSGWFRLGLLGCVSAVAGCAAAVVALDVRPDWLFRSTLDDRLEALQTGIAIFSDHWLTGAGPYTYLLLDDVYANRESGAVVIVHAHNVYVQVLADLGVVGAAAMLAGTAVVFGMFLTAWRRSNDRDRLFIAAGVAATAGFMVHGLSDAPPSWNSVYVPFAIVIAVVARLAPMPLRFHPAGLKVAPRVAVVALIAVMLLAWVSFDTAHKHYDLSLTALQEDSLDVAAAQAVKAAETDDQLYAYALHAGVMLVRQYQEGLAAGGDPSLLYQGIAYLWRATELDPHGALAYTNLAFALELMGDQEGAVAAARMAITDRPGSDDINTAAGTVFERAGLHDEAVQAFAAAISFDAGLSQSPFWSTSPERVALRKEAVAASGADACEAGYQAALYGVFTDDLAELAGACELIVAEEGSAANTAQLALALGALGRDEEAREHALQARSEAPQEGHVLIASALLLSGDISDRRYELLKADAARNRDAKVLLLATYVPGAGSSSGIALPFDGEAAEIPVAIQGLIPEHSPDSVVRPGNEASARAITYYAWGAQREAPPVTLIAGDWSSMASPRSLLFVELGERLHELRLASE